MDSKRSTPIRKILMTADTIGGVWTYSLELAAMLAHNGIEIVLATMGRKLDRSQLADVRKLGKVSVHESEYKLEWMEDSWTDVDRAGEWILGMAEKIKPDCIHLNGFSHAALPWHRPVLIVAHSCVYSWYRAVKNASPPQSWETYHSRVSRGLSSANCVVAPTRAMADSLRRNYGDCKDIRVIYNGRQIDNKKSGPKQPYIFTAGRFWDEAKNIGLLEAVAGNIPWPVYAAGEMDETKSTIRKLGMLPSDRLVEWLHRASIFAMPARYEPFGLAVLEAALAGCALVLGDIPSLREIWGESALYVPVDQPHALHDTLVSLVSNPAALSEKALQAQQRARQFTPDKMAFRYIKLYEELLKTCPTKVGVDGGRKSCAS